MPPPPVWEPLAARPSLPRTGRQWVGQGVLGGGFVTLPRPSPATPIEGMPVPPRLTAAVSCVERSMHVVARYLEANMEATRADLFDRSLCDELDDGWDSNDGDRTEAHRISILRAYFARFGLTDPLTSKAAARRVVSELRATVDWNDAEFDRRLVAVARKWMRDFSESGYVPAQRASGDPTVGSWSSRSPILLSKFPSAFLATPLPASPT